MSSGHVWLILASVTVTFDATLATDDTVIVDGYGAAPPDDGMKIVEVLTKPLLPKAVTSAV